MKRLKIVILLGIMILGAALLTSNQNTNIEPECEHDWAISSKYSWLTSSYRTVSKCSKCGKVVK